jgi:hypothetical protein
MVKKHEYQELDFTHFVVFTRDGTVFGCAKRDGHIYNFLIRREEVHRQRGMGWRKLEPDIAEIVRKRAANAAQAVPTYRTDRMEIS